jgi:Tfp pilus assembly protein FimT
MARNLPRTRGLGLIELQVVAGILTVLAAVAAPSLDRVTTRQRMQGVGESFRADLQMARMQAVGTGRTVRVAFGSTATGSCYVVYQGAAGACKCSADAAPQCLPAASLLTGVNVRSDRGVQFGANSAELIIDGQRGTVTPTATVRFTERHGSNMAHIIAITGRVRTCGDAGRRALPCQG